MSFGGNPATEGSVDLDNVDEVKYLSQDVEVIKLDGVTIWEKALDIVGTATFDSLTKRVTYSVELGKLASWSYRAVNQTTQVDTGEIAVSSGTTAESGVLSDEHNGVWDVTFKGFDSSGEHRSTFNTTVTVSIPFVEITFVEYIADGLPPLSPGDELGLHFTGTTVGPDPIVLSPLEITPPQDLEYGAFGYDLQRGTAYMTTNGGSGTMDWIIWSSGALHLKTHNYVPKLDGSTGFEFIDDGVSVFAPVFGDKGFTVILYNWLPALEAGTTSTVSSSWRDGFSFSSPYNGYNVTVQPL